MQFQTMINHNTSPIHSLADIVTASGRLSQILDHIENINRLQAKLSNYLEAPLNQHVVVADYRQQTLVLHADSAAWTTRLRYRTRELLAVFKTELPELCTIHIKNRHPAPSRQPTRQAARVTPKAASALRAAADGIADPSLRRALLKIAATATACSATENT